MNSQTGCKCNLSQRLNGDGCDICQGQGASEAQTTAVHIDVLLLARATCSVCGNWLELKRTLQEEQLRTGNTTQTAAFCADFMRKELESKKQRLLWDDKMCGSCRVEAAEKAEG